MSAYSTLHISRSRALKYWRENILKAPEPTNEELQDMLDKHLDDRLYNCWVMDDCTIDCTGSRCDDDVL